MPAPPAGTVLKRNVKRTVRFEHEGRSATPRVVKRFHAPALLDRTNGSR